MRLFRSIAIFAISATIFSQALAQEPSGGQIMDLVFFGDTVNQRVGMGGMWSFAQSAGLDHSVAHSGSASFKYVLDAWNGGHHVWRGKTLAQDPTWGGPDTCVYWAQANSRLQFWVRSSVANGQISFDVEANGVATTVYPYTNVGAANTWYYVDAALPAEARNQPLKNLKLYCGATGQTLWLDDLKITNVRLYAGLGEPSAADFEKIAASQIGYAPTMQKQFSSPVEFTSFQVVRVSDGGVAYTGGAPISVVTSGVIGNRSVWIGDLSALTTPGRYKIVTGGKESYPFDIGTAVFDQAVRAVQRMFYYQRAFTAIQNPYAEGPWVHGSDANLAPAGVTGGWHDAGDLTVYFPTMAQAIQHLLDAWTDFRPMDDNTNIPESGNGIPDLLDETRWGLNWILSMQDPSGGFWTITCANGGNNYSYGTNPPTQGTRPTDVSQYTKVTLGTPSTAKGIAVLAYASVAYREFDTTFANTCLAAARRGWAWLLAHSEITDDAACNAYPTNGDQTVMRTQRMWAAAALLYATGESQYATAFENNYEEVYWIPSYGLTHAYAAKLYLRSSAGTQARKTSIRNQFLNMANGVRTDAQVHPFNVGIHYYWGALNNALQRSANFSWYGYLTDQTDVNDLNQALANVHYVFGRNYLNKCYVSGLNGASDGMQEAFHFWLKALNATPHDFPGMMGAGPNESPISTDVSYPAQGVYGYYGDPRYPRSSATPTDGRYTDNDSWSTNEQVISWNAVLLYNLYAARMVAHGGSQPSLPTGTFSASPDTLPAGGGEVTLSWTSTNAQSATIDNGVGNVPLNGSVAVTVGQTTQFKLTLANTNGSQDYFASVVVPPPGGGGPLDITMQGTTLTLITNPTGSGNPNIEVIRDGVTPPIGTTNPMLQYDSYNGSSTRPADWFGYTFSTNHTFVGLVFQEGMHFSNGGWWSALGVQVHVGGVWTDVSNVSVTPPYSGNNGMAFETFQITFPGVTGDGIRLYGTPGGSTPFVSVGELRVMENGPTSANPDPERPKDFALEQNFPNPFNPTTNISFLVPTASHVKVSIYNMLGQEVRTLFNADMQPGRKVVMWDGVDNDGRQLSSGTYIYRLIADNFVESRKMLLLK